MWKIANMIYTISCFLVTIILKDMLMDCWQSWKKKYRVLRIYLMILVLMTKCKEYWRICIGSIMICRVLMRWWVLNRLWIKLLLLCNRMLRKSLMVKRILMDLAERLKACDRMLLSLVKIVKNWKRLWKWGTLNLRLLWRSWQFLLLAISCLVYCDYNHNNYIKDCLKFILINVVIYTFNNKYLVNSYNYFWKHT